jgi:2-polyprenyl-3-methyl-5-hydroxy-6-metoxy-1,4-benzoquinol methylase
MGSERDTDADWNQLGKTAPFWAVLTDDRFRGQELDDQAREAFYASGYLEVAGIYAALQHYFDVPDRIRSCLDFGAGVGRLLVPMAGIAEQAVGVDIAESMRDLCQNRLSELALSHVKLVATPKDAVIYGPFDWVNSFIVLQHIPPARGLELIGELAALVKPGGFFSLHVTCAREAHLIPPFAEGFLRQQLRDMRARFLSKADLGRITMYDYDLNQVLKSLTQAGCKRFMLDHTNHGGHLGYMIYGQMPLSA